VAGEIGVPVYYGIPEHAKKNAQFDSLAVDDDTLDIVLTNTGNVHLRINGEVNISTFDKKLMQRDSLPEFVIMPGKQRKLRIGLKEVLDPGDYIVEVIFDYGAIELLMGERRFRK
jgi:P pilus assembly chaperone PapD